MSNTVEINRDTLVNEFNKADKKTKEVLKSLCPEDFFSDELPLSVEDALQRIKASDEVKGFLSLESKDPFITWLQNVGKKAALYEAANKSVPMAWNNPDTRKYYGWYVMGKKGAAPGVGFSYSVCVGDYGYSDVASRLCLHNSDHVEKLHKRFPEIDKAVMLG